MEDKIKILVQSNFELANTKNLDEIMNLYKNVIKTTLTTWDDDYPNKELILKDIKNKELFILKTENSEIISVAFVSNNFESNDIKWKYKLSNPFRFARICTHPNYQRIGVGTRMLSEIINFVKKRNCDGMQILVYVKNVAAIKLYEKFGFENTGEYTEYGYDYYSFELKF
jgi:ribosomal protein S18 acetylase RimI-like enzyme